MTGAEIEKLIQLLAMCRGWGRVMRRVARHVVKKKDQLAALVTRPAPLAPAIV